MEFQSPGNVTDSGLNSPPVLNDTCLKAPASMAGGDRVIHHSWEVSCAEQNAVGKPFSLQSMPVTTLCHRCQGLLWSSGLCGLCWDGVSWCPCLTFLCAPVPWNPSTPTPVSWSGGRCPRLAHCRLFPPSEPLPSHTIHLHLLSELSYSSLCCLSSGYMTKRVRQGKIKKKKKGGKIYLYQLRTKRSINISYIYSNTWAFAPVPSPLSQQNSFYAVGVLVSMHFSLN